MFRPLAKDDEHSNLNRALRRLTIATSIFLYFVASPLRASEPIDFSGEWWSGRCAHIELSQTGDRVSGHYDPNIGAAAGRSLELIGYRTGVDLIAFVVSLGPDGPLVAWAGQHTVLNGEQVIVAKWHMATDVPDELETEDSILGGVWTGADMFKIAKPTFCP